VIHAAGLPGLAALATGLFLFAVALVALAVLRWRRRDEAGGRRDALSLAGIAIQALGGGIAASGPVDATLDPLGSAALVQAAVTALLLATALGLVIRTVATRGRTRSPIAPALVVIALALALGHLPRLVVALPVYALGTWLRARADPRPRYGTTVVNR
jgi:chromate transport protein ChrA